MVKLIESKSPSKNGRIFLRHILQLSNFNSAVQIYAIDLPYADIRNITNQNTSLTALWLATLQARLSISRCGRKRATEVEIGVLQGS